MRSVAFNARGNFFMRTEIFNVRGSLLLYDCIFCTAASVNFLNKRKPIPPNSESANGGLSKSTEDHPKATSKSIIKVKPATIPMVAK